VSSVRQRRLGADCELVSRLVAASGETLLLETISGEPASTYVIRYHCRGVERVSGNNPVYRDEHRVRIDQFPANYPVRPLWQQY
jgi:hypothetical protein